MRIAFVGIKRKYLELPEGYRDDFNRYHLELPYYYAGYGGNDVTITTVDYEDNGYVFPPAIPVDMPVGKLTCVKEESFVKSTEKFDVVVHWRMWFPELYRPEAINVINCQDHSLGSQWVTTVRKAYIKQELYGILCFPTWHKRNLNIETGIPLTRLLDGVTLGVDTDIYKPSDKKDPYQLLWSSDPGRGLAGALEIGAKLWQRDKRFRLHVCHPDYVKMEPINHPAIVFHGNVPNGPKLWDLFNETGVLPYTSMFPEPSSRAHRQAQAAGALVLYPPAMGSPSELIRSGITGIVADPVTWIDRIQEIVGTEEYKKICRTAREFAVLENWSVQAARFNRLFERLLDERRSGTT
jgi:glycosyltransferase involved in cell wall biosynthesis